MGGIIRIQSYQWQIKFENVGELPDSGNAATACQSWVLSQALRGGSRKNLNKGQWLERAVGQPSEQHSRKCL